MDFSTLSTPSTLATGGIGSFAMTLTALDSRYLGPYGAGFNALIDASYCLDAAFCLLSGSTRSSGGHPVPSITYRA